MEPLPKRKSARLRDYDYSTPGYYFITICTHNRAKILSEIIVGEGLCALPTTCLTATGKTVENAIEHINNLFNDASVEKYVIMPNHIHLIVHMKTGGHGGPPLRVYDIVQRLKSFTTHQYGNILWQRSFHDHIIRGEQDYAKIWNYIDINPQKWNEDCFFVP